MEFLLDTINIEDILEYNEIISLAGVTSNPSIIKSEGKINFYQHMKKIQKIIGESSLHIQVVSEDRTGMINDAREIVKNLGKEVFIKIPVTKEGLSAIKILKNEGYNITATAIYSEIQGLLAIASGVDYIAPYYNRMEDLNIDSTKVIRELYSEIERTKSTTKILAASFKNLSQINKSVYNGAHAVTLPVNLLNQALESAPIIKAVKDFSNDWRETFSVDSL